MNLSFIQFFIHSRSPFSAGDPEQLQWSRRETLQQRSWARGGGKLTGTSWLSGVTVGVACRLGVGGLLGDGAGQEMWGKGELCFG